MPEQYLAQTQEQRLQMVLAPQLRQSLELLQVPILELRTLIQQELQSNPTLEEKLEAKDTVEIEPGTSESEETKELDFKEEFEVLARLDDEWREYFQQAQATHRFTPDDEAKRQFFLDSISRPESLQEHLLAQLAFASLDQEDHKIAEMIIGSISGDGYLATPLDDLARSTGHDVRELEDILTLIQEFDPIGVGARDLRECLLLQLQRLGMEESPAALLVRDHLDALGAKKFQDIARALKIPVEEVQKLAHFIATLEPKPGRMYSSETAAYVLPEVAIQKVNGEYAVILNNDQVPHLRISKQYRQLMADPNTPPEVISYIREKIRAGTFLIKSISQRQQTIYNIAREIVRVQHDFFDHGVSRLRPLTMAEIAGVLGVHETTVSRAIANKYMQTPQGTFEMKYFFTPGYRTADGQEVSNKTIKDTLTQLVADEDPKNPLSDQAMTQTLKERGIQVARRTIAKYREELHILPSHLRKSF
ncbi:MAG: RNA polymerase factor sigma-54 [Kiritimatiellae bacterium]|nr:RNA polymerase factor sigma-54 [Kiritimatiellia bacterium]